MKICNITTDRLYRDRLLGNSSCRYVQNKQTFKTVVVDNSARSNENEFVNMMDKFLENQNSSNKSVIISGDMKFGYEK